MDMRATSLMKLPRTGLILALRYSNVLAFPDAISDVFPEYMVAIWVVVRHVEAGE